MLFHWQYDQRVDLTHAHELSYLRFPGGDELFGHFVFRDVLYGGSFQFSTFALRYGHKTDQVEKPPTGNRERYDVLVLSKILVRQSKNIFVQD